MGECPDWSRVYVRRPLDRGYVINWNLQAKIWWAFLRDGKIRPAEHTLLALGPMFTPESQMSDCYEVVFEEMAFQGACFSTSAAMAARRHCAEAASSTCLVVDTGFSFSHACPFVLGLPLNHAVRRLDVGGKALSNLVRQQVSLRTLNILDEPLLANHIKETCCFVSADFEADLSRAGSLARGARSPLACEYVLPDYRTTQLGRLQSEAERELACAPGAPAVGDASALGGGASGVELQTVTLNLERFSVPEVLFRPQDIGIAQAGLHELAAQALAACPALVRPDLLANVRLIGGNARMPGLIDRFTAELRAETPSDYDLRVFCSQNAGDADDPILYAWRAASWFASSDSFPRFVVSKAMYDEHGAAVCKGMFQDL